jgi:two-component system sensor histidine kinase DegS
MAPDPVASSPPGEPAPPGTLAALADELDRQLEGIARELVEIELLVGQARTEAARHEQKRALAADKLAAIEAKGSLPEITEAGTQLVALTRRAAVMEAQVDVLAGKQKTMGRYRDGLVGIRASVDALADGHGETGLAPGANDEIDPRAALSPAVSRVVLAAQEDLRRDIARAMHDGPAQSLTNIVLQAQIVERLLDREPEAAGAEVRELVAMVQRTLEATKTFIFDVRPMVLDDLGLVPTLRRVARDRGRRAQVPVEFESLGTDRRLPMEEESAVFRVADEAVAGLASGHPERVVLTLDWADELELVVRAVHPEPAGTSDDEPRPDMPAALREMVDDRRARAAEIWSIASLTPAIRRVIADRAVAAGGRVEFAADGMSVTARFPLDAAPAEG